MADVWKVLDERRGVLRNTVHTLVSRLEEKGWLTHRDASGGFLYQATGLREAAQQQSVQQMVETVFGGSAEGLVLALVSGGSVSKAEANRIRKIIEIARGKKP